MYKTTFSLKHYTKKSLYVLINNMKHSSMYLPMANKTPVILINQKVQNIGHFHLAPMFNPPFTFLYYLLTTNIRNTGYIYLHRCTHHLSHVHPAHVSTWITQFSQNLVDVTVVPLHFQRVCIENIGKSKFIQITAHVARTEN